MHRRTYLVSVASVATLTAGSGCISSAVTRNNTDRVKKTVTVSNVEQPTDLELDVTLVEKEITPQTTARVALRYTNPSEEVIKVNLNPEYPNPLSSTESNPGLILLSDAYNPIRKETSCWKPEQKRFPQPAVAYRHPIDPGQSITLDYDVWAAPQQEADCIKPDTYQFNPLYGSFALAVSTTESGN